MSKSPTTDKIWDDLRNSWAYWNQDHAHEALLNHARKLEESLRLAAKWGMRSNGFSADVSDAIRNWIDGGMKGNPPKEPEYYL